MDEVGVFEHCIGAGRLEACFGFFTGLADLLSARAGSAVHPTTTRRQDGAGARMGLDGIGVGSWWFWETSAAGWGHLESDSSSTAQESSISTAPRAARAAKACEVSRATSSSTCSAALRCEGLGTSGGCLARKGVSFGFGRRRDP